MSGGKNGRKDMRDGRREFGLRGVEGRDWMMGDERGKERERGIREVEDRVG